MKKIYFVFCVLGILLNVSFLSGQTCTAPPPPSISGATLAACTSSASFTLTANTNATNSVTWLSSSSGGSVLGTNSVFTTPTLTSGATYYAAVMGAATSQTLTMPTHTTSYSPDVRGYWFQAPVSFVINGVFVPTDVGTGNASAAVIKLSSAPPSFPTTASSFTTVFLAQNVAGVAVMTTNINVLAGEYIGVLGCRAGVTSYGTSPFVASLGSTTMTITRFGMQYPLATTSPQDLWTESGGYVGRVFLLTSVGCQSSLTPVSVSVVPNPQISIAGPTTNICSGSSATLTASGLSTYTWQTGPTSNAITVSPNSTTTYSVIGAAGPGCSTVAAITVTVDTAPPSVGASSSQSVICIGNTISLSGSGGLGYSWSNNVPNNTAFSPTATSSYTVSSFNGCGTGSAVTSVVVNPLPNITVAATSNVICDGDFTTLTASGGVTYTWSAGNQTATSIQVNPSQSTGYSVLGTSSQGCINGAQLPITVNPTPAVGATAAPSLICTGQTSNLYGSGTATSYSWSSGALSKNTSVNPMVTTLYTITGSYATGCFAEATVLVEVYQPTIAMTTATSVCLNTPITLTAGVANSYTWSNGSLFSSTTVTPAVMTLYTVAAMVTDNNVTCLATNSVLISIYQLPTVTATPAKPAACKNEKVSITAGGANTYKWHNNSTGATFTTIAVVAFPINYTVTGTDQNGCNDKKTGSITVNICSGLEEQLPGGLVMYPVPSAGTLNFRSEATVAGDILDAGGKLVGKFELNDSNGYSTSVSDLAPGVYLIVCHSGEVSQSFKALVSDH